MVVYLNNSGFGCDLAIDTTFIIAIEPAIASFDATPNVQSFFNPTFDFINSSINATNYSWNLGECDPTLDYSELFTSPTPYYDPNSFNILNYTYGCPPGVYEIQLIATNMGYCPDTLIQSIKIEPDALLYVPNAFIISKDAVNIIIRLFVIPVTYQFVRFTSFVVDCHTRID